MGKKKIGIVFDLFAANYKTFKFLNLTIFAVTHCFGELLIFGLET